MGEWQRATLDGILELSLLQGVSPSQARAFEGRTATWEGEGVRVILDATMYADPLTARSLPASGRVTRETIDGRPVRILSYEEGTRTHLAAHFEPPEDARAAVPAGVTLIIEAGPEVPSAIPWQVVRSVRFLTPAE